MLKRVLKTRVSCNESEASDAEWRLDVAQDICQALNIVDHFSDGDKWEVVYEDGDNFVTVKNTSVDDYMDGKFCEVEIDNVWAKCFAAPQDEGGDYVLIGKVRWLARDLLDKVTDLVGCGSECALEAKKQLTEARNFRQLEQWIRKTYKRDVTISGTKSDFSIEVKDGETKGFVVEIFSSVGEWTVLFNFGIGKTKSLSFNDIPMTESDPLSVVVKRAMDYASENNWFVECRKSSERKQFCRSNKVVKTEASAQAFKFSDIITSDTLWDMADEAIQAKRNQWGIPDAAETGILICTNFNKLCELEAQGVSKDRLLKQASYVQDQVQRANREMDGGSWMASWKRWLGSDFNSVKRQMIAFASDLAKAIYDLKNAKESKRVRCETTDTNLDQLRGDMSAELIEDLKVAWKAGNRKAELLCFNHKMEIQKILKKYGDDMYGMSDLSFFDFRGGFDSLARDILLCADIITDEDIERRYMGLESSRRSVRRCESANAQDYVKRSKELEGLSDDDLLNAVQPGDILVCNGMIPTYYVIKRKTAKSLVVHEIDGAVGNRSDNLRDINPCPELPPKEMSDRRDVSAKVFSAGFKIQSCPRMAYVWDGSCGNALTGENAKRRSVKRTRKFERENAIYSQKHADRARELANLSDQALLDALQPGDILEGTWGYNRTITDYFIVKRKTAKRVVVHKLVSKNGNQPGDSWGGWTVCPVLPPKEDDSKKDVQGMMSGKDVKIADYPKYLSVYQGDYGWENMD